MRADQASTPKTLLRFRRFNRQLSIFVSYWARKRVMAHRAIPVHTQARLK